MLETDSPALGPDKGGMNVPANIVVSAAEVSELLLIMAAHSVTCVVRIVMIWQQHQA